ncbi:hypothetical protein Trydic_g20620, partial [Trypoxylus dichotomus]
ICSCTVNLFNTMGKVAAPVANSVPVAKVKTLLAAALVVAVHEEYAIFFWTSKMDPMRKMRNSRKFVGVI